jgi:LuxR family maltose regulon positive regulatory protein
VSGSGLVETFSSPRPDPTLSSRLTPRELEVLQFAAEGMTRDRTAEWLQISPHTVHTHQRRIFTKLRVHTMTGAVAQAIRDGVVG